MKVPIAAQFLVARYRRRHAALICLLLLVLVARALVPVGFMPAADGSAQLTLCPDGMQMPGMPASGHFHTDHCPFGAAPFAAPIAHPAVMPLPAVALNLPVFAHSPALPGTRAARSHQPRAPPARIVV